MSENSPGNSPHWSLQPVIDWLFAKGCRLDDNRRFIRELGHCLDRCGAGVGHLRIVLQTLHPQIVGVATSWTRATDSTRLVLAQRPVRESERYIGSPLQQLIETRENVRQRLDQLPDNAHGAYRELADEGFSDYLAMPILTASGYTAAFIVVSEREGGFHQADLDKLQRLRDYLVPILEVQSLRHLSRALLNTYIGKRTSDKVLSGMIARGDSDLIHAALWFSDLRNFTELSETLDPAQLIGMLNDYFEFVGAAAAARGGEILRFIGDAMLIVFPIDAHQDTSLACNAALDAALDARNTLASLNHRRRRQGLPAIEFGVGLNVGEVVYGNVGSLDRLDFTVMGTAVNRAARLESLTRELAQPILFSHEFAEHLDVPLLAFENQRMKGIAEAQTVYALRPD
ncbi:MAG: adenylate/guanylate cyclase domain-containing protein [Gammaproteobacteria bacterium]|nr:adenylate/guanylate cyclase domain-containing protein [Gammaproteobacteria bacterium]